MPEITGQPDRASPKDEKLTRWYDRQRDKIRQWVADHSQAAAADYLLLFPDLVVLLVRLIRDPCVPLGFKGRLLLAAVYVFSPLDLIPEMVLGVAGLADDVLVIAVAILSGLNNIDHDIIRQHWSGREDIIDVIYQVTGKADEFLSGEVAQAIKDFFAERQAGKKGWRHLFHRTAKDENEAR